MSPPAPTGEEEKLLLARIKFGKCHGGLRGTIIRLARSKATSACAIIYQNSLAFLGVAAVT
jgi:hypothetical protein